MFSMELIFFQVKQKSKGIFIIDSRVLSVKSIFEYFMCRLLIRVGDNVNINGITCCEFPQKAASYIIVRKFSRS